MRTLLKGLCLLLFVFLLAACSNNETKQKDESPESSKQSTKSIQVLVIGIDSRGEAKSRSDAILIGQYNPVKKSIKIASIMRDTYVKIPTYSKGSNKINMAYFLGGNELLVKTIKENFGITIDHVVTIDFQGFTHVIDAIAPEGIEVEVTEEMIADMNLPLQPGKQFLHGEHLLKYVRFRHDAESDFGRVKRQQEVMVKIKNRLTEEMSSLEQIASLPKLMESTLKYVESDLSLTDTLSLTSMVFLNSIDHVETMTIPVAQGFTNKTYEHAGAVLQMDQSKNIEALNVFFNIPKAVNN
ncbi:LCP family protein [Bacillus massiliigorillae]|uniref:LCP family protein n=1 Tax=Bacillus massiliigorillae TaxID=1243664 RepID=UPI0003A9CAF2|nr:LCP family protein [Bacillus massiliigorillae]